MTDANRPPGWDRQAIMAIASRDYGGLPALFAQHGWDPGEKSLSQIVSTLVVGTYGSVESFERAHPAELPDPVQVIESADPDVWLTSYYGFSPDSWGLLGFTKEWMRRDFLANSKPGALIVIYGAGGAPDHEERGRILGIQQQSHIQGNKRDFVPPDRWAIEQSDQGRRGKWDFALKATRAWQVTRETRPTVQDFAPVTYSASAATLIGARGRKMTADEARGILGLDLVEVSVFAGPPIECLIPGAAVDVLRPSRPGPVSQSAHMTREAEGPKHLYVLQMHGNTDHLLGEPADGKLVVKVGFSRSPDTRRLDHNRALPACAFRWEVKHTSGTGGREPFPSSRHALAGEKAMKDHLERQGRSLGGEFFLAPQHEIDAAWIMALRAAEEWTDA